MQAFVENFHFLRPWLLLLIFIPLAIYKVLYGKLETLSSWEKVCDKNLLQFLLIKGSSTQRRLFFYLCVIGFISTVIALAGPSWQKQEVEGLMVEKPVILVLNLSSDMAEKDVTPNRLSRAKYAIADLLSALGRSQTGLIVYAGEPFLISPITEDTKVLQNLLPAVDFDIMPENGDRLDRAINLAVSGFENGQWQRGQIVVFAGDVGQEFSLALQAAQNAAAKGYTVNVVNVASSNNEKLKRIARQGNGVFENVQDIAALGAQLSAQQSDEITASQNKLTQWLDAGYYLCFIPLLCCLYLFRRGLLVILVFCGYSFSAQAGFFRNADQEGLKAFSAQQYEKAAAEFKDSKWQASSQYRLGNYEKAYQYFSTHTDTESLYNQGNALAKAGKIEDAIKKYEEVLRQNPTHEDAKFNLEYLKQQQNEQQEPQSGENDNQDNQDEQQQNEQSSAAENQEQQEQNQNQNDSSQQENSSSSQQEPSSDNNQSGDGQEDKSQESNQQQQSSEPQDRQNQNTSGSKEQQQIGAQSSQKDDDNQEKQGQALQKGDSDNTYNEEVQARELQYREIPEDPGGLLRAFIAREYAKDRYAKDK